MFVCTEQELQFSDHTPRPQRMMLLVTPDLPCGASVSMKCPAGKLPRRAEKTEDCLSDRRDGRIRQLFCRDSDLCMPGSWDKDGSCFLPSFNSDFHHKLGVVGRIA